MGDAEDRDGSETGHLANEDQGKTFTGKDAVKLSRVH